MIFLRVTSLYDFESLLTMFGVAAGVFLRDLQ